MRSIYIFFLLALYALPMSSQDIFGKWVTFDENGMERTVVEIYEEEDRVYGKIIEILDSADKEVLCEKCDSDDHNRPILGLMIIKNLKFDGTYYRNGSILSPEKGKRYKCRLSIEKDDPNVLEVRSYIAFMHETQFWRRLE